MEIIQKIRLFDGSEHRSTQQAERHLFNILSSGNDLKLFEALANKSTLKIKEFFIENYSDIVATLQAIEELKNVEQIKNFN